VKHGTFIVLLTAAVIVVTVVFYTAFDHYNFILKWSADFNGGIHNETSEGFEPK
jgi:predicted metalloprotease with PDZ domain